MAEKLTPQQQMAVTNRGGNLLVSAAAGSGKTKVLVDRLMRYLLDPIQPANLDDFLIITYTKAAAAELRGKIAAKLTDAIATNPQNRHLQQQMQRLYLAKISTVHAFCGDLLREYAYQLDISGDFRVADEPECLQAQLQVIEKLLDDAYANVTDDPDFASFVDTQGIGRDDRLLPELILKVYDSARCHLHPDNWLDNSVSIDTQTDDPAQTLWGKYLTEDLKQYVKLQTAALDRCSVLAEKADGFEKPAAVLQNTCAQLEILMKCVRWDEIRDGLQIDFGRLTFPRKCSDPLLAEQIKAVRNACKTGIEKYARRFANTGDQILTDMWESLPALRGLVSLVKKFTVAYERLKRSRRFLDFGDLEHKTLDLLLGKSRSGPTAVAAEIGKRYREIMVDEYQDSNAVQDAIFSALTVSRNNCFMVGDVKQSIYQFRLADPDIFLGKYKRFAPAETAASGQDRKVILSSNFRSGGGVISAVNDVFSLCMSPAVGGLRYGEEEALREGIPHISLPDPEVELYGLCVQEDTYAEEAAFTARRIAELLDGKHMIRDGDGLRSIRPGDIVILLRSPGSVGNDYRIALENAGIPCTIGGAADLLQTEEVAVLHGLLQVISNPLQDIPLLSVLSSRLFCFTADELASFRSADRRESIYHALQMSSHPKALAFIQTLSLLRTEARLRKLTELISCIFTETRLDSVYAALPDGAERVENLQSFCQMAEGFESGKQGELSGFLDQLAALAETGLIAVTDDTDTDAVTIMSIHKSKGLEFPVVFLCGLSRMFNRESTRAAVLCDKNLGIGLSCTDSQNRIRYPSIVKSAIAAKMIRQSVSEEMRVLYVAMTRARDRLIMLYSVPNLASELSELSMRQELCSPELLAMDAECPGKWILMSALRRIEAGAFFALCEKTGSASISDFPWLIRAVDADGEVQTNVDLSNVVDKLQPETVEKIRIGLAFRYPYGEATKTPSKQTATQLKGRDKDQEAAEYTHAPRQPILHWRSPAFIDKKVDGRAYGKAIHAVMQFIRYEMCGSREGIASEIQRLVADGYISEEYGTVVDQVKILNFFTSPIGIRLRNAPQVLREFKFSVLIDTAAGCTGCVQDKALLQGVVDCAIIEENGITVIDFKTDYVTDQTIAETVDKYRPQIGAYAEALSKIYGIPVKSRVIYLFSANKSIYLD